MCFFLLSSPLHNSRVVLRRLSSAQAQRRGKRAIEVCGLSILKMVLHSVSEYGFLNLTVTSIVGVDCCRC